MKSLLFAVAISLIFAGCGGENGNLIGNDTPNPTGNPVTEASPLPTQAPAEPTQPNVPTDAPAPPVSGPSAPPSPPDTTSDVPDIDMLTFVKVTEPDKRLVDAKEIRNGSVIDRNAFMTQSVNLVAMSKDESKTGSVRFNLDGPTIINRLENAAPYTLANQTENIDLSQGGLANGSYTLIITPYEKPDGEGAAGTTKVVVFSVIDGSINEPDEPVIVSKVPNISSIKRVRFDDTVDAYTDVMPLTDGDVIDLGKYATAMLNIVADSDNSTKTGSVGFDLVGPTNLNRYENSAIYTLQRESTNFSVGDGQLNVGDYTLSVIPYELADLMGEKGNEFSLSFSIVKTEPTSPPPPPTPTKPPVQSNTVVANDDAYTVESDKAFEADVTRGVASNDTFSDDKPIFSIIESSKNGVINMDLDGSFTYTPNNGFAGQDTFVYELSADGKKDQATARVRVFSQNDNGGFTTFNPSSDSRVIYVSSSKGNDKNTCLSEALPCKTISEGIEKMREGFPDHLLLKRGDVWTIGNRSLDGLTSGRSKQQPTVFSYYGDSGVRPIIQAETEVYRQDRRDVKHVRWVGLHFYAYKKDPLHPNFNPSTGSPNLRFIGGFSDIHIEDCKFEFTEVTVQQNTKSKKRPADFRFKRNIFYGSYSSKSSYSREGRAALMFTYGVDNGLNLEENVFDTGGWNPFVKGAGANQLSHNVYMQSESNGNKTTVVNNIFTRAASHGIQMRSGGFAQDNFFARNTIGLLLGYNYGGREIPKGTSAHAINNVISEGMSMFRGIDYCVEGSRTCTGALWGLEMTVNSSADYQAHGNIISKIAPADKQSHSNVRISNKKLERTIVSGLNTKSDKSLNRIGLKQIWGNGRNSYPQSDNIVYRWKNDSEGASGSFVDPERTLSTYNTTLGGGQSFDEFMQIVINRPLGTWDSRYEARSINAYIREGFKKK